MTNATRPPIDWENIEKEYRAGQLSVAEIARQHGLSHPAILKRAKRDGWTRNLALRIKEAVTAKLVTDGVTGNSAAETVELAAARGVQVIREHRTLIGKCLALVQRLVGQLDEASEQREEIEVAIHEATSGASAAARRAAMMRAVSLVTHSQIAGNLGNALKTLIALERQAFALDDERGPVDTGPYQIVQYDGFVEKPYDLAARSGGVKSK
jgi:transposase-like protein